MVFGGIGELGSRSTGSNSCELGWRTLVMRTVNPKTIGLVGFGV